MKQTEGFPASGLFRNIGLEGIGKVLSYKKPAFWIVIAAAVICAGIFVFCAANPKARNDADASGERTGLAQKIYASRTEYEVSDGGKISVPGSAVYSPDGSFSVWSNVQENLKDENGKFHSVCQVLLCNIQTGNVTVFDIVGRDFKFLWSEDSKFLVSHTRDGNGRILV